jgi:outer membrane protein, heavy metal efflux system
MLFTFNAPQRVLATHAIAAAICVHVSAAHAQAPTIPSANVPLASEAAPLSLNEAFRIALAQQPWTSSRDAREREQRSRESLADSWLAEAPTIVSGVKTGNRDGLRELEFEISAPIAGVKRRAALLATARGESQSYRANVEQEKLKLAGQIRDAFWAVQLAASERDLANDEVQRAQQLAADSAKRTKAGEAARVDTLRADVAVQAVVGARIEAEQRLEVAKLALRALLGARGVAALADVAETRSVSSGKALNEHPTLLLATQSAQLAQARLSEASTITHAAPTLSFTLANERTNNSASSTTARIGLSMPLGSAQRATQRIALAGAELAESQASVQLTRQQLEADVASAESSVAAMERRIASLVERSRLANEVAELYAKAYRLGELDLPTRLRAEGERASANLALSRARIELKHALSRVNQSLGLLP